MQSMAQGQAGVAAMRDRALGAAMMVAAVLQAIAVILHPAETPEGMAQPIWGLVHVVFFLTLFVLLLAVVRLYGLIAGSTGWMGLAAMVVAALGVVIFESVMVLESGVMPVLASAETTRGLLDESGPLLNGTLGFWFMGAAILTSVGFIAFGLLLLRSPDLPRWAGPLLVVAPLFAFSPPLPDWLARIALVVFSVGMLGLGWGVWKLGGMRN
jgi:hypothetical protein